MTAKNIRPWTTCFSVEVTLLFLLPLISAYPLLERSATISCSQYGSIQADSYSLLTNIWGEEDATRGSQCSRLISHSNKDIKWSTDWEWIGGHSIKSFSCLQLDDGINQELAGITSMSSVWSWDYSNTASIMADVAYDFFTSWFPGGPNVNEVMVWLANFNSGPISYQYNANGQAIPIETDVSIAGYQWNLYLGSNDYNEVYSYLPVDGNIPSFKGDMWPFFSFLIDSTRISNSQYLVTAQAGTEVTSGSAKFETLAFSLTIDV